MNQRWVRNSFIYLLILVAVVAILFTILRSPDGGQDVNITDIITMAQNREVDKIIVDGNTVIAVKGDSKFESRKEDDVSILELLSSAGVPISGEGAVKVEVKQSGSFSNIFGVLLNFLPLIFFGAIILFMMRQAQGSNNQAMSFGRSRARMFIGNRPTVTFSDVAGVSEAKEELQEIVEFLKFPERFATLGRGFHEGSCWWGRPELARP